MNFLLHLFRMGYDTQRIADNIGVDEWTVYNLLHAQREAEHDARLETRRAYNREYQRRTRDANKAIREARS